MLLLQHTCLRTLYGVITEERRNHHVGMGCLSPGRFLIHRIEFYLRSYINASSLHNKCVTCVIMTGTSSMFYNRSFAR
jgi:hypothetical protein